MTNEEAVKLLINATYSDEWQGNGDLTIAHYMAIKALEFDLDKHDKEVIKNTVETLRGEPCEDCISRKAVLNVFEDVHPMDYNTQAYITKIQELPSVRCRK